MPSEKLRPFGRGLEGASAPARTGKEFLEQRRKANEAVVFRYAIALCVDCLWCAVKLAD